MNILVIRFSSLGDLVTQDSAYRSYRHFYPKANIVFLTSSIGQALYAESNHFNEYITYDGVDLFSVIKKLKKTEFDIVFNSQCSSISYVIESFIKSKLKLHQSGKWWQKLLNIKTRPKWHHELLQLSGVSSDTIEEYMKIRENSISNLQYQKHCFDWQDKNKKTVAVAIGASPRWQSKKWGDDRYMKLINILISQNYTVVLIGSKSELEAGEKIEKQNDKIINLIDKTSLSKLKSVLASVDLLISNDSGPAHLAAGVGTNTLTIFGSTDIKHCVKFGGYNGKHDYLVSEQKLPCQPCYKPMCPTKHECMEAITVERVALFINDLLGSKNDAKVS